VSLPSRRSDGPGFRLVLKFLSPHQVFRLPLKFQARILLFCFLVLLSALVFGLVFISRVLSFPVRRSTGVQSGLRSEQLVLFLRKITPWTRFPSCCLHFANFLLAREPRSPAADFRSCARVNAAPSVPAKPKPSCWSCRFFR
jgi:hypothetical protein